MGLEAAGRGSRILLVDVALNICEGRKCHVDVKSAGDAAFPSARPREMFGSAEQRRPN